MSVLHDITNEDDKVGATKHCCYGDCKSDSRYKDRPYMQGVTWTPFPKPKTKLTKCQRWVYACGRDDFTLDNVRRWTYICSNHFVGGKGPTTEHPDPIPATYTPDQTRKFSRKRKAPTPRSRSTHVPKKVKSWAAEALLSLQSTLVEPPLSEEKFSEDAATAVPMDAGLVQVQGESNTGNDAPTSPKSNEETRPTFASKETQTRFACKELVAAKITAMLLKKKAISHQCFVRTKWEDFTYAVVSRNATKFHFYTGLTVAQFRHLFECVEDDAPNLTFWRGSRTKARVGLHNNRQTKLSPKNQLLLTLVKLRQDFPNRDLAYRFDIGVATVSVVFNTWIQFLYMITAELRQRCFPSRELIKEHRPPAFKSFKNVRVIIDCFEVFAQQPRNFAEQGNMYSSYKNHTTMKGLVGIAPTGGISFLSDMYEGSISDRKIVIQCGFLDRLDPDDLVIADRGFNIKDMLQSRKVNLNIPPFLNGRDRLTPQEEMLTKRIARVRIHVERAIERMKKFKIIGRRIPQNIKPMISQIVHVIGFLVNYQEPLVQ